MRQTHTYALLEVPAELYDFVAKHMVEVGYDHVFAEANGPIKVGGDNGPIDMQGVALTRGPDALYIGAEIRRLGLQGD